MNIGKAAPLRAHTGTDGSPVDAGAAGEASDFRTLADLVADLISLTELVPADRLAAARGRAGTGPLAQALVAEGVTRADGVAAALARRYGIPFFELGGSALPMDATGSIPVTTLKRAEAIPVALVGDRLKVAVADPGNIHGIDELRLSTRHALDLVVGVRDDILQEIEKLSRNAELNETQSALDEILVVEENEDDLEADDGVSDAPLVRLVNSIIMQAAGDGASDIHFAPQEDCLVVRVRVDGVLTPIETVEGLLRGVQLPEGNHQVVFEFRPRSVTFGASLTLLGLVALALIWRWEKPRGGAS